MHVGVSIGRQFSYTFQRQLREASPQLDSDARRHVCRPTSKTRQSHASSPSPHHCRAPAPGGRQPNPRWLRSSRACQRFELDAAPCTGCKGLQRRVHMWGMPAAGFARSRRPGRLPRISRTHAPRLLPPGPLLLRREFTWIFVCSIVLGIFVSYGERADLAACRILHAWLAVPSGFLLGPLAARRLARRWS